MFIVIEGCDGAGTTTQTQLLWEALRERKLPCAKTAEPSTGPIGSLIRQVLSRRVGLVRNHKLEPLTDETLAALFAADRLDHLANEVESDLKWRTVICDRYLHSTLAYQCKPGDYQWALDLNAKARVPDVTFYVRVDAATAIARVQSRGERPDIMDGGDKIRATVERYDAAMGELIKRGHHIVAVDGSAPAKQVHATILAQVIKMQEGLRLLTST